MTKASIVTFVTYYLQSLAERTRRERSGTKWGIDWVAYNIGIAQFGTPVRLPFLRSGNEGLPKSKVEAEFGVDLAFLSEDKQELTIFVLKDEPLTNRTWTANDFDRDLRMAMSPDLSAESCDRVVTVRIILAYNKDDEQNGIEAYDRFVTNAPSKLRDTISIVFTRWNLSELVAQTIRFVLSPALLPERFFGQLSYVSAQAADFRHGSDEWERQLMPNWRQFVLDVLREDVGIRALHLVPVALITVREHAGGNPSFETGWIELIEAAALSLWTYHVDKSTPQVVSAVRRFWDEFYIRELEEFYERHIEKLAVEHSIDERALGTVLGAVAAGWIAYWHLARLGILALDVSKNVPGDAGAKRLSRIVDWTTRVINANVSVFRPVLDIHHIQIFLLASMYTASGRVHDLHKIFAALVQRLFLRRIGASVLPFLDGWNSLDNVFEHVATSGAESSIQTDSSFLVLMLLEMVADFPEADGDVLLIEVHSKLIWGAMADVDPSSRRPLNLMTWVPPDDWLHNVIRKSVVGGEAVSVQPLGGPETGPAELRARIQALKDRTRSATETMHMPPDIPVTVGVLASLRRNSPIPPPLWRALPLRQSERNPS